MGLMGVFHFLRLCQGREIKADVGIELARTCGTGMNDLRTAAVRFFDFGVSLAKMVD